MSTPLPRSGHSASLYGDHLMLIFGGIFDVTKELNDLMAFDLAKSQWVTLFEELGPASQSPTRTIIDNNKPSFSKTPTKVTGNDMYRP